MSARRLMMLVLLLGCRDKGPDLSLNEEPPPLQGDGDSGAGSGASCGESSPVIEAVWCENTGIATYDETGGERPTMAIHVDASDADGGLHTYQLDLFYDEGTVSEKSELYKSRSGTKDDDECETFEASMKTVLYLAGQAIGFETTYEWGYRVADSDGNLSELGVATCTTPAQDGTGDP